MAKRYRYIYIYTYITWLWVVIHHIKSREYQVCPKYETVRFSGMPYLVWQYPRHDGPEPIPWQFPFLDNNIIGSYR
jgi:hypothetical protein